MSAWVMAATLVLAASASAGGHTGAVLAKDTLTYEFATGTTVQYQLKAGTRLAFLVRGGKRTSVTFSADNSGSQLQRTWITLGDVAFFDIACANASPEQAADCELAAGPTSQWAPEFVRAADKRCGELGIEPFQGSVFLNPLLVGGELPDRLECWDSDDKNTLRYGHVGVSDLVLQPLPPGRHLPSARPQWTFGPFDEGLFCFNTVEVFAEDVLRDFTPATYYYHSISLLVHLVGTAYDSWWFLSDRQGGGVTTDSGPRGGSALDHVTLAAPNAKQPILNVGINSGEVGDFHTRNVLMDLRSAQPGVIGEMTCGETEYVGMPCSFGQFQTIKSQVQCVWDRNVDGFLCQGRQTMELSWATKSIETCFVLGRDKAVACASGSIRHIQSLPEVLADARRGTLAVGSSLPVAAYGTVMPLLSVPTRRGPGTLVVLAVPTAGAAFEPDLLVVQNGANGAPEISKIDAGFPEVSGEGSPEGEVAEEGLRGGSIANQPPFGVLSHQVFFDRGGVRFFRIVITQGKARGLLLIAIDDTDASPRFGSILVATDAVLRGHCGDPLRPSTAVAISKVSVDGRFVLDLEPAFKEGGVHGSLRDGCRTTSELSWDHSQGFVAEPTATDCRSDLPSRLVRIADDGSLTYTEAPPNR